MLFPSFAWRRVASGLAVALAGAVAFAAHAAEPLTLAAAVRQGVAQAPMLTAHRARIDAAREEAARAGRLPDPSLTFGLANYPVTAPGAFSLRSDGMTMRTIGVRQVIPSQAARMAERDLADAEVGAATAEHTATTQALQEQIADAWIGVWAVEQQRDLLQALRDEAALAVQVTDARLRGGAGNAVDALAARSEVALLDNRQDATQADLAAARASLERWVGPGAAERLAAPPDFSQLPVSPGRLEHDLDEQAPMQVWETREQVAQAALDQARAAKHPDWSVSASYGKRAPGLSDMVMLEVGVSLPLFTRNRQDRGISAKQAQWDAVQADHEDARRAQREAVARNLAAWQGWGRRIGRYRDTLLPLARDRASIALAAYRGGGALQPWLDARRDEIDVRLQYADALVSRARLWAALAYLLPTAEAMR
ncbi:TolC family protein [Frateuria sp.]|uniref:TolC family protein n=1 Tax=Frateuria sp. TaxID=2211372 RepID=UPI00181392AC|nr:TolC family protein [Frateuria sp.]NUR21677.1 TolC family protein [Frateuria sp.]